jgi:hypothetical protein
MSRKHLDLNEKANESMLTEQETAYLDQLIFLPTLNTDDNFLLEEDKKEAKQNENDLPNLPIDIIDSLNSIVAVGENDSSLSNSNELSLIQTTPILDQHQTEYLYSTAIQVVEQPLIEPQDEPIHNVNSNLNIIINENISHENGLSYKEPIVETSLITLPNEAVALENIQTSQEREVQQQKESTSDKENSFKCQELCCVLKFNTFNYDDLLLQ